ncbi:MAG: PHB depolymerase family esterase [Acidimicrobiales bacterium]
MQPFSVNPQAGPPAHTGPPGAPTPPAPPQPPKARRRWFWWGCLPAVVVVLVVLGVVAALLAYQRDSGVEQSNGTVLPPNTVTTPVPDSTAVTASCAVQQGLITRDCAIITPPDVAAGTKLPVVFLLHGLGDGPVEVRGQGDWANAVVEHRFMLVTPSGVANSWNAGGCCGIAKATGIDDVSYLGSLVADIAKRPDVDPKRIYMAGFSNGGMMVYRFLCVGADLLAGAASVSGTKAIDCAPKRPIPILHIHGTGDETVPYRGGAGLVAALLGASFPPVPTMADGVAEDDGCTAPPTERTDGDVTTKEWSGCADGARVELVSIANWPHQWPLSGSLDATTEVLKFFGIV